MTTPYTAEEMAEAMIELQSRLNRAIELVKEYRRSVRHQGCVSNFVNFGADNRCPSCKRADELLELHKVSTRRE